MLYKTAKTFIISLLKNMLLSTMVAIYGPEIFVDIHQIDVCVVVRTCNIISQH